MTIIALRRDDFVTLAAAYHATRKAARRNGIETIAAEPQDAAGGFVDLWQRVRGRSLLDPWRGLVLARAARRAVAMEGDIIECGSARGGGAALLALASSAAKRVFVADLFTGLPEPDRRFDRSYRAGQFATPRAEVEDFLAGLGVGSVSTVLEGNFAATLPALPAMQRFALVHIDGDLYASTVTALAELHPRMVAGGRIVFDDLYDGSGGVLEAAWQHLLQSGELLLLGPTGQCSLEIGRSAVTPHSDEKLIVDTGELATMPSYRRFLAVCLAAAEPGERDAVRYLLDLAR